MKIKSILALALFPMLVGCGATPSGDNTVTITDMQGRTVTYDKTKVNRVVCVGAGALRLYSYVGDMSKLVGSEDIDGANTFGIGNTARPYYLANKEFLSTLPSIGEGGPNAQLANTELILAANPDIVVSFLNAEANEALGKLVPTIGLKQGRDGILSDEIMQSLELIANVFGRETRYNELKSYINNCKADFANLTIDENVKTYGPCIAGWGQTDFLLGANYFPVFKYAKVKNVLDTIQDSEKQISQMGAKISMETLLAADPDRVFIDGAGYSGFASKYKSDADFRTKVNSLPAFQNGEVYKTLPYNAYYTNLEIQLMSTFYVASVAHPEAFANFDIAAKCNEVTTMFNGKAMYTELSQHPTGLGGYHKVDLNSLLA